MLMIYKRISNRSDGVTLAADQEDSQQSVIRLVDFTDPTQAVI